MKTFFKTTLSTLGNSLLLAAGSFNEPRIKIGSMYLSIDGLWFEKELGGSPTKSPWWLEYLHQGENYSIDFKYDRLCIRGNGFSLLLHNNKINSTKVAKLLFAETSFKRQLAFYQLTKHELIVE